MSSGPHTPFICLTTLELDLYKENVGSNTHKRPVLFFHHFQTKPCDELDVQNIQTNSHICLDWQTTKY